MQQQGYDKLAQDAQKTLDDTLRAVEQNADKQKQIVSLMLDELTDNYQQAYNGITDIVQKSGITWNEQTTSAIDALKDIADRMSMLNGQQVEMMVHIATNAAEASAEIQSVITAAMYATETAQLASAMNDNGGSSAVASAGSGGGGANIDTLGNSGGVVTPAG
jgi:translation initiation factor 2 alpha subunit (eIF-2alpha)